MRRLTSAVCILGATGLAAAATAFPSAASAKPHHQAGPLPGGYKNLVVIYEENHSFDNLYGGWGRVNGQRVEGRRAVTQVAQDGTPYGCLPQNDVNLTSPPLSSTCTDPAHGIAASHFTNAPFTFDDYIKPDDTTCPPEGTFAPHGVLKGTGLPGGCTQDQVHRFYQEQYQLNGGRQNRYVTGSDAVGSTVGVYDTKALPIYRYLHGKGAPNYVLADHFFQAAFGGSFLNHQWLIAARSPLDTSGGGLGAKTSVLDSNGMPTSYDQYKATGPVVDGQLTQACAAGGNDPVRACGAYAVNTVQPSSPPASASGAKIPLINDAVYPNIGDRMTAGGVSWNWYSGGWDDAVAGHPGGTFQYHHQPFNYFANYAPGTPGRSHLQDEKKFFAAAKGGTLPQVSFVKPYGSENEHPGYASEHDGSDHLVDLLEAVTKGPQAKDTLVVVTYDEFGGSADHVAPPTVDAWGPGTRIPALVLSAGMKKSGVSRTSYDTTSILATIERAYGLPALSPRDAAVNDLAPAVKVGNPGPSHH
ncbi:alkaline phosphatase family protein [Luteipulveratus flavus]|uniref:Alkaline phosphatase family protein n=1 Tax=Luteipulveratus flavus TaxID=3031728 RepID=A0ABT6CAY0_9MICO|nr:alkaline phosphatase family protein [Luteipulveratus sp. YIM 133296]MDF8265532.1 alkaline phosphatase family protein [Luteipulveratus sp. YIM 133296]